MRITMIHGQMHRGSTWHIADMIRKEIEEYDTVVDEFYMPGDGPGYCVGCYQCINKEAEFCPHSEKVVPVVRSMEEADLIIVDSPAYCLEMTGQIKSFFDHLAHRWISHRPSGAMYSKVAVVVSTSAGAGAKNVVKALKRQLFWMGISKVYKVSYNVSAASWDGVPEKTRHKIETEVPALARKVRGKIGKARPTLKSKLMFNIMRGMQKSNDWNMVDRNYWKERGWLGKHRPWK